MTDDEIRAAVREFTDGQLTPTSFDLKQWLETGSLQTLSLVYEAAAPRWASITGASREEYSSLVDALLAASLGNPHGIEESLTFIDVSRIYLYWLRQLANDRKIGRRAQFSSEPSIALPDCIQTFPNGDPVSPTE